MVQYSGIWTFLLKRHLFLIGSASQLALESCLSSGRSIKMTGLTRYPHRRFEGTKPVLLVAIAFACSQGPLLCRTCSACLARTTKSLPDFQRIHWPRRRRTPHGQETNE